MNALARKPPPLLPGQRAWTADEDAILRARYETEGAAAMARALGRPLTSIHHRTQRLKLYTHRKWTKADDNNLAMMWGELSLTWIARRLKRTRVATYYRARALGLGCGTPRGMEYVRNAADRAGFALDSLMLVLAWAGVTVRPAMSRPSDSRRRFHIVDPQDVDDAVARWMASETMDAAGKRLGFDGATIARWVERSGRAPVPRPGARRHWRVPTEIIDQVVAARAKLETLSQSARRLGIDRTALRRRLIAAGHVPPPGCHTWFIDPARATEASA